MRLKVVVVVKLVIVLLLAYTIIMLSLMLISSDSVQVDQIKRYAISDKGREEKVDSVSNENNGGEEGGVVILKSFHRKSSGENNWELVGEESKYYPQNERAFINNAQMIFYDKNQDKIVIIAKKAEIYFKGGKLVKAIVSDGVQISSVKNRITITAQNGVINLSNGLLSLERSVKINRGKIITTGRILTGDINERNFILKDNVQTYIPPQG